MSVAVVIGLLIIQSNLFDLSVCFSHFLGPELKRKFCEVTANGEMLLTVKDSSSELHIDSKQTERFAVKFDRTSLCFTPFTWFFLNQHVSE